MPILKEGIILKNSLFFSQTEKNYYCSLCYGSWNPNTAPSQIIFGSESTETRFSPLITTGWDDSIGKDFVNIEFTVNYPVDILYNRVVLYYGGLQRSRFTVNFNGFNSLSIVSPKQNDFQIGDRILYNSQFYFVSEKNGMDLGLTPDTGVDNLPQSGSGDIIDASGIPIIGSVFDDVYLIENNTEINFFINGTSS